MAYDIDTEGKFDWLRLSFTPDAIREHFSTGDSYSLIVDDLTDEELSEVGEWALSSDVLYKIFHELLVSGLGYVRPGVPKED